jgi:hypothetical protein
MLIYEVVDLARKFFDIPIVKIDESMAAYSTAKIISATLPTTLAHSQAWSRPLLAWTGQRGWGLLKGL